MHKSHFLGQTTLQTVHVICQGQCLMASYLEAFATLCINYRGKPKGGGIKDTLQDEGHNEIWKLFWMSVNTMFERELEKPGC